MHTFLRARSDSLALMLTRGGAYADLYHSQFAEPLAEAV